MIRKKRRQDQGFSGTRNDADDDDVVYDSRMGKENVYTWHHTDFRLFTWVSCFWYIFLTRSASLREKSFSLLVVYSLCERERDAEKSESMKWSSSHSLLNGMDVWVRRMMTERREKISEEKYFLHIFYSNHVPTSALHSSIHVSS